MKGDLQATIEKIAQNPLAYLPSYAKDTRLQASEIRWITLEVEWEEAIGLIHPKDLIVLNYDWNIEDLQTVKQISQRVHEGGGKFGIRFPIAEIHTAVLDRPEWRLAPVRVLQWRSTLKSQEAKEEGGEAAQQPAAHEPAPVVYCVLSDYGYYLTQAVKTLLEETAADLLIFDRPILGSQDGLLNGCNALGHQHYTRAESIGVIYRWLFQFADHLRREYPGVAVGDYSERLWRGTGRRCMPRAFRSVLRSVIRLTHHTRAGLYGGDSVSYAAKILNTVSVNRVNSADEIVKAGMI